MHVRHSHSLRLPSSTSQPAATGKALLNEAAMFSPLKERVTMCKVLSPGRCAPAPLPAAQAFEHELESVNEAVSAAVESAVESAIADSQLHFDGERGGGG